MLINQYALLLAFATLLKAPFTGRAPMSRIFGRNLAALRAQHGVTLAELAQHLGFHASYLSHMERGRRLPPKREDIMRIADVLTASASERQQLWDAAIWSVAVDGIAHERVWRAAT